MIKKITSSLIITLITYLVFAFQVIFGKQITIFGIQANFIIILFAFLVIFTNFKLTVFLAIVFGILEDLQSSSLLGITSFSYIISFYALLQLNKIMYENNRITIIFKTVITTLVFELIRYSAYIIIAKGIFEGWQFFKIISIELIFVVLLCTILYPFYERLGPKLYDIYNEQNILTRYF